MSSAVPPKPTSNLPGARPAPAGAPAGGAPAIDPIKLLKKWKYVLAASVVVGAVFGLVGHFVWVWTWPIYQSTVTYEALPPQDPSLIDQQTIDEDAIEQFMATQADRMLSMTILERVAQDPRLQAEAPNWSQKFVMPDGTFDYLEALERLEKMAKARPVGGTYYVRMQVSWKKPEDAAGIARLLREAYLTDLQNMRGLENSDRRTAIQTSITNIERRIDQLTERRSRLIRDDEITGLAEQATITREKLSIIAMEKNNIGLEMQAMQTQLDRMNEMLKSEGGVPYTDTQRQTVEMSPIVQQMKANKELLETRLTELRRSGIMPGHREYKMIENQIAANEQQISLTRERELAKLFDAERDTLESQIRQSQAQIAGLLAEEEDLLVELQDVTRTITEIGDITDQIEAMNQTLAERNDALEDIEVSSATSAANRMIVRERERVPDRATLPQLLLSIPAGVLLISGLTAGIILAAEFLDQRVKSPADLAAMPRMRILGTVPLADEDPTVGGHFNTVMRDASRSVVAESFRQLRTTVLKKMDDGGHKTCLFFAAMPGSGASSMVSNLALAASGVNRRVLVIDANFRRPSMHAMFGLREGPGLSDVLAGDATLESAVQEVSFEGGTVHVLTAGSASKRVFERLGTEPMTAVLASAGSAYDVTFVDTAPAIVAGDAMSLAQRCDASIQVTRAMAETRGLVGRVKNDFADAPAQLLGVVVNAVRSAAGGYMKRNIRTSAAYHAGSSATSSGQPKSAKAVASGEDAA
jgi:succinoglycan biosynthesis transport protein ExoP